MTHIESTVKNPSISEFSPQTQHIADLIGLTLVNKLTDIQFQDFEDIKGLILDADGTLYEWEDSYGPDEEVIEWVQRAHDYFEGRLIIITDNTEVNPVFKIPNSTRHNRFNFKASLVRNNRAIKSLGVKHEEIAAATDSPTDIVSNFMSGISIKNQFLVRSLGAHPKQEFAHKNVYPLIASLGSTAIRTATKASRL